MKLARPDPTALWASRIRLLLLSLALIAATVLAVSLTRPLPWPANGGVAPAAFLLVTAAATLSTLAGQLPAQNVILASVIIIVLGSSLHIAGALSGVPFGAYTYKPGAGKLLLGPMPWTVPFLWLVFLLNSRGVARLALRPWRNSRYYGFWVFGATALLVVLLELGLEPFATRVQSMWTWQPTKLNLNWYDTPETNFLGWTIGSLLILAFVTPVLINKAPIRQRPDYAPLALWEAIMLVLLTAAATRHWWTAVIVLATGTVTVLAFALWGIRTTR
jgi:bisanhydrobacterioruberin hydratase